MTLKNGEGQKKLALLFLGDTMKPDHYLLCLRSLKYFLLNTSHWNINNNNNTASANKLAQESLTHNQFHYKH